MPHLPTNLASLSNTQLPPQIYVGRMKYMVINFGWIKNMYINTETKMRLNNKIINGDWFIGINGLWIESLEFRH